MYNSISLFTAPSHDTRYQYPLLPVAELVVGPEPVDTTSQEEPSDPDTEALTVHHAPLVYGQFPQYLTPCEARPNESSMATGAEGCPHQLQGAETKQEEDE